MNAILAEDRGRDHGTPRAPHTLVVTITTDDEHPDVDIECPGVVAGQCWCYWTCQAPGCRRPDDGETQRHGVEHRMVDGDWSIESTDCWLQEVDDLAILADHAIATPGQPLQPGRYLVDYISTDDDLELVYLGRAPELAAGDDASGCCTTAQQR